MPDADADATLMPLMLIDATLALLCQLLSFVY